LPKIKSQIEIINNIKTVSTSDFWKDNFEDNDLAAFEDVAKCLNFNTVEDMTALQYFLDPTLQNGVEKSRFVSMINAFGPVYDFKNIFLDFLNSFPAFLSLSTPSGEKLLSNCTPGTYIIKLSDSEVALDIAYLNEEGKYQVNRLLPSTIEGLHGWDVLGQIVTIDQIIYSHRSLVMAFPERELFNQVPNYIAYWINSSQAAAKLIENSPPGTYLVRKSLSTPKWVVSVVIVEDGGRQVFHSFIEESSGEINAMDIEIIKKEVEKNSDKLLIPFNALKVYPYL